MPLLTLWLSEIPEAWQRQAGVGDEVDGLKVTREVIGVTVLHAAQRDQRIVCGSATDGNRLEVR